MFSKDSFEPPRSAARLSSLAMMSDDINLASLAADNLCMNSAYLGTARYRVQDHRIIQLRAENLIQTVSTELKLLPDPQMESINLEYCWAEELVGAMIADDTLLEFETFFPYAYRHIKEDGTWHYLPEKLSPKEQVGLNVGSLLRRITSSMPHIRPVILADDINEMPEHLKTDWEWRSQFIGAAVAHCLKSGILLSTDTPGRDFVLLLESQMHARFEDLLKMLQQGKRGELRTKGLEVSFFPSEEHLQRIKIHSSNRRKEMRRQGILLRDSQGDVTCQAMDASGFLGRDNIDFVHLLFMPEAFESEQDKAYALISAMSSVRHERFHNIFFADFPSEVIEASLCHALLQAALKISQRAATYSGWNEWDASEYVSRNYMESIMPEDQQIISLVAKGLQSRLGDKKLLRIADIGAGPNLYPAMLMAPWAAGSIELWEPGESNLKLLADYIKDPSSTWQPFAELMALEDPRYSNILEIISQHGLVIGKDVYSLPENHFDLISSFFVSESMCDLHLHFRSALDCMKRALTDNGLLVCAHMLGSRSYPAGAETVFPALPLDADMLKQAYSDIGLSCEISIPNHPSQKEEIPRQGYHGMAVVFASKLN